MKVGIIKEGKTPPDKRVALSPLHCTQLMQQNKGLEIVVECSNIRSIPDSEYEQAGIKLTTDVSDCDILIGIKEVPKENLIPGKKYMFFSHTIKKQPHNRALLQSILSKKIQLIDYECLVDNADNRIIGFGRFAGIVGAYNTIRLHGLKYGTFALKAAQDCEHKSDLEKELRKARLKNIRIAVTGGGRVGNGALEMLGGMKIRKVSVYEYMMFSFNEPVYTHLHSSDYHLHSERLPWNSEHFYAHPETYISTFNKFSNKTDMLIHCAFWHPRAPRLFSLEDMGKPNFTIRAIGDITCDINGSIPCTTFATTINEPYYEWEQYERQYVNGFSENTISVMAVDNLPCSLPRDASIDFGGELVAKVFPSLLKTEDDGLIIRASITKDGKLTERFAYLSDYVA